MTELRLQMPKTDEAIESAAVDQPKPQAEPKKKKADNPAWYVRKDWLSSEVDLSDGGWGIMTIEEPSAEKADSLWDSARKSAGKNPEEIEAESVSAVNIHQLAIYVAGGSDPRLPETRYDLRKWKTLYGKIPRRAVQRLIKAIELFVAEGESEGN